MRREAVQFDAEALLAVDQAVLDAQTGALQLTDLDLGVSGDILDHQYADLLGKDHRRLTGATAYCSGTRLVSTQYRP
ncbi:MAG: hypothetical protein ACREVG_03865, partial [Burkholderiales bacterium]